MALILVRTKIKPIFKLPKETVYNKQITRYYIVVTKSSTNMINKYLLQGANNILEYDKTIVCLDVLLSVNIDYQKFNEAINHATKQHKSLFLSVNEKDLKIKRKSKIFILVHKNDIDSIEVDKYNLVFIYCNNKIHFEWDHICMDGYGGMLVFNNIISKYSQITKNISEHKYPKMNDGYLCKHHKTQFYEIKKDLLIDDATKLDIKPYSLFVSLLILVLGESLQRNTITFCMPVNVRRFYGSKHNIGNNSVIFKEAVNIHDFNHYEELFRYVDSIVKNCVNYESVKEKDTKNRSAYKKVLQSNVPIKYKKLTHKKMKSLYSSDIMISYNGNIHKNNKKESNKLIKKISMSVLYPDESFAKYFVEEVTLENDISFSVYNTTEGNGFDTIIKQYFNKYNIQKRG